MNRFIKINLLLIVISCTMVFSQVNTTTFFKYTTNTGGNHTIAIPNNVTPMVRQSANAALTPISPGDEIGVFWKSVNGQYLCVGGTTWIGDGASIGITAWQDNPNTDPIDGFTTDVLKGESLIYYKIYVAKTKYEYFAQATYNLNVGLESPESFKNNGASMLTSLQMLNTIGVENPTVPEVYTLSQNYPNPFNPSTKISYTLPKSSYVTLTIYDLNGKEIAKLLDNQVSNSGTNYAEWNGKNAKGILASSGVYFYKIEARNTETGKTEFLQVKSMLLMK